MGHGINANDTQAFVATPAWHPLGTVLEENTKAKTDWRLACTAAGLDWEVGMAPLTVGGTVLHDEDDTRFEDHLQLAGAQVPGKYVTYRKDDNTIFNVVGKNYHPFQNKNVFNWFDPFLKSGEVEFDTMGSLKSGRTVWALAKFVDNSGNFEIGDGDKVEMYLALVTSHAGEFKNQCIISPTRIVCQNTLSMAQGSSKLMAWKHTKGQHETAAQVRETINVAKQSFEVTAESFKKLRAHGMKRDDMVQFFKGVIGADPKEELHKRTQGIIDDLVERSRSAAGAEMAGSNLWGAYNAVTNYTSHSLIADRGSRVESSWLGNNKKMNERALSIALQIAG